MSELVIVKYGVLPSDDYEVLAYGEEALSKALSEDVVERGPVNWDGTVNHVAVGGSYAVISPDVDSETLREIQDKHDLKGYGAQAITDDEDVVELELTEL